MEPDRPQRGFGRPRFSLKFRRRSFQIFVAIAFVIIPLLNRSRYSYVYGNFLSFHMFGIPLADPLAIVQLTIRNLYLTMDNLVGALLPLSLAVILGAVFCSWICPFGLLSELIHGLANRKRADRSALAPVGRSGFSSKLSVFALGFIGFFFFSTTPILNQLSMPAWYTRFFQYLFGQDIISLSILFLVALLFLEFMVKKRFWCRYVCPQSVLLQLVKNCHPNRLRLLFNEEKCICRPGYERCEMVCSLGLKPKTMEKRLEFECSNCGDCIGACANMGQALSFSSPAVVKGLCKHSKVFSRRFVQPVVKGFLVWLLLVGAVWQLYGWVTCFKPPVVQHGVANELLVNHVLSWDGSRAGVYEFLDKGVLVCVGGDWPTNGYKAGQWETVDRKGSFKMRYDSSDPSSYVLVTFENTIQKNDHFTVETFSSKNDEPDKTEEHILRQYAKIHQSHSLSATTVNATSTLSKYMDDIYIQDLLVQDPEKKIKKILTHGDAITTEGMLTNGKYWLNTPQIIVSEGSAPELPIHTAMTIIFRDGHREPAVFVTESVIDRSNEEFEDPWF